MSALDELLAAIPAGAHVRIIKTRRYPQWNPWRIAVYRHERQITTRGFKRKDVYLAHADAPTVDDAAAAALAHLNEGKSS